VAGVNRQRAQDRKQAKSFSRRYAGDRGHRTKSTVKSGRRLPLKAQRNPKEVELAELVKVKKELIRRFNEVIPTGLTRVPAGRTGVNFEYWTKIKGKSVMIPFDFRFSFGEAGPEHIGLHVKDRHLINSARWTMVLNPQGTVTIFRVSALSNFVKAKWGSIPKDKRIGQEGYVVFPVKLKDILSAEGITPIVCKNTPESMKAGFNKVLAAEFGKEIVLTPTPARVTKPTQAVQPKFTSKDAPKRIGPNSITTADQRRGISAYRKGIR